MAARETGIGAVETFMHAGKLLALDLLVQILQNKAHIWGNVRQEVGSTCQCYSAALRDVKQESLTFVQQSCCIFARLNSNWDKPELPYSSGNMVFGFLL